MTDNVLMGTLNPTHSRRDNVVIRLWAIVVRNSFLMLLVLKMFIHQLHSFQSCADKFSVQYRHLDKSLTDCLHTTLSLHFEAFDFPVLTRNEESEPIRQGIQHQFLGSFQ